MYKLRIIQICIVKLVNTGLKTLKVITYLLIWVEKILVSADVTFYCLGGGMSLKTLDLHNVAKKTIQIEQSKQTTVALQKMKFLPVAVFPTSRWKIKQKESISIKSKKTGNKT